MRTFPRPLIASGEREYLEHYKEGDQETKNVLIERNMRLVAHVVKKYQYTDYGNENLLSVGTIGLVKAVNTFNIDRGSRLTTYAAKCVENEILVLLRAHKKYPREVSLFEPIGVDKDGETAGLMNMIKMDNREILEPLIAGQNVKELYRVFEVRLKDNEKAVIGIRYELFGGKEYTRRETADMLNISRSYVSRIEKKAVEKLRTESEWHR